MTLKSREMYGEKSSFPLPMIRNRKEPQPIKEKLTVIKKRWFLLGSVRVASFFMEVLFC